jgi:hypothetical protein
MSVAREDNAEEVKPKLTLRCGESAGERAGRWGSRRSGSSRMLKAKADVNGKQKRL